jgi:hypothetical protein
MAISPNQRAFSVSIPADEEPKQIRAQRAKDRAKALGLKLKLDGRSQRWSLTPTKQAVVPVDYLPMTLDEVERELTQLAKEHTGGC